MATRDQLVLQHRPAQLACASQLAQHKPTTRHVPSAGTQLQPILTAHSTESTTNMPAQPWVPMPCAQDCHVIPYQTAVRVQAVQNRTKQTALSWMQQHAAMHMRAALKPGAHIQQEGGQYCPGQGFATQLTAGCLLSPAAQHCHPGRLYDSVSLTACTPQAM
jgi:hypothetical protein